MTLCTINHLEKVENGVKYEKDEFTLGKHYKVERYISRYEDGDVRKRICVHLSLKDERDNYIPKIYYEDDFFGTSKPRFEIQTTAYGSMNPEEIKKVIAGYQEAIEAVEILTKNFC